MKSLAWLKVTLRHPPVAAEALSALLFEAGAEGLWEDPPDRYGRLVTLAAFDTARQNDLAALMPKIIAIAADSFGLSRDEFKCSLEMEENHDWAEKWKEGLAPVKIGQKLVIAPTFWPDDAMPEAEHILRLDPGLAFGSGHHATTFLCLALLTELAGEARSILDVGAGSGILTMAAAILNPKARAVGVDNDISTIVVAEENAALNNLRGLEFSAKNLSEFSEKFDLIVANITLNPLLELALPISGLALEGDGRLILSGLLETQAQEAAAIYEKHGFRLVRHLGRDEWSALLFAKGGAAPVKIIREPC